MSPQDASDPVPARSIATAADIATLIAHLRTDPNACWVIPYVRPDFVWRDHVVGRAALGALDTCLANLGSEPGARVASEITGRQFFPVSEARAAWRTSTGDEAKYRLLEQYIDDARNGRLADRTITLFDDGHPRVVDGNKRAVAIYETAADPGDRAPLRRTSAGIALPEVRPMTTPSEGQSVRVSAARPLASEITWDQRDSANLPVPSGRYNLRLRVFFSSSAGAGAAFASASVELESR